MDNDKNRGNIVPPNEFQREEIEKNNKTKEDAKKKLAEEHDDVKTMNKMMLYSKCVTIRD